MEMQTRREESARLMQMAQACDLTDSLFAGASACRTCIAGTFSPSTGAGRLIQHVHAHAMQANAHEYI
jgi:hypothetical protein